MVRIPYLSIPEYQTAFGAINSRTIGTPLFGRKTQANGELEEITVVRAGIFDDSQILNEWKPQAELFTDRRVEWVQPVEGAAQVCGMLPRDALAS